MTDSSAPPTDPGGSGAGGVLRCDPAADAFEPIGTLTGQGGTTVPASFAFADGALLLGGRFRSVAGVYSPRVARWTGTRRPTDAARPPGVSA